MLPIVIRKIKKKSFQQSKDDWKKWKNSDDKTVKIQGEKQLNKLKENEKKDDVRRKNVKRN